MCKSHYLAFSGRRPKTREKITPFAQNLLVSPQNWENVISLLQQLGIVEKMRILLEWLPKDLDQNLRSTAVYGA